MTSMLRKKEVYTTITPIPGFIPRQLAIDILHSHSEVITLNPLVLDHKPIKAPRNAQSDEYYSTWYEIIERVQFVPGLGRMGSGKITFNGCFHDMPWGLQTHIYAPMSVDLRNTYRIAGNQPGYEPPETAELGLGAPAEGLYLREDIEIRCNLAVVGFVKAELKAASKEMVSRIIKKAELLDAGVLQAMIEDGKLKTINPADRTNTNAANKSPLPSPASPQHPKLSPVTPYQVPRPTSSQQPIGGIGQHHHYGGSSGQPSPGHPSPGFPGYGTSQTFAAELPSQVPAYVHSSTAAAPVEMPGDFYHHQSQQSTHLQPSSAAQQPNRDSIGSSPTVPPSARWSGSVPETPGSHYGSRPNSRSSETGAGGAPFRSPGLDHKGFANDLSTHRETREEYRGDLPKKVEASSNYASDYHTAYSPADYYKVNPPQQEYRQPQQPQQQQQQQQQRYGY